MYPSIYVIARNRIPTPPRRPPTYLLPTQNQVLHSHPQQSDILPKRERKQELVLRHCNRYYLIVIRRVGTYTVDNAGGRRSPLCIAAGIPMSSQNAILQPPPVPPSPHLPHLSTASPKTSSKQPSTAVQNHYSKEKECTPCCVGFVTATVIVLSRVGTQTMYVGRWEYLGTPLSTLGITAASPSTSAHVVAQPRPAIKILAVVGSRVPTSFPRKRNMASDHVMLCRLSSLQYQSSSGEEYTQYST
jgi:hypothetical protein